MVLEIGRVCVKIAGRESGKTCVVVDRVNDVFVLIDGNVRRKRCNILHLEPTGKLVKIKAGADTKTVLDAMKKEGLEVVERKQKKEKKAKKEEKAEEQETKEEKRPKVKQPKETKEKKIKTKSVKEIKK